MSTIDPSGFTSEIAFAQKLQQAIGDANHDIKKFKLLFNKLQGETEIANPSQQCSRLQELATKFSKQKKWTERSVSNIQFIAEELIDQKKGGRKRKRDEEAEETQPPTKRPRKQLEEVRSQETEKKPRTPQKANSLFSDYVTPPLAIASRVAKHKYRILGRAAQATGALFVAVAAGTSSVPQIAAANLAFSAALFGLGHRILQLNPPVPREVPIAREDRRELLEKLEQQVHATIKGQDYAKQEVLMELKMNLLGGGEKNSCLGCFFFAGPTGVGKTELAMVLATELLGGEDALLKLSGGEFTREEDIKKLTGTAPGYIGYDKEGGVLAAHLKKHPYSIVLFDEIEKAHTDLRKLLLGVLDGRGSLMDNTGKQISVKNTIFIFTSNVGADFLSQPGKQNEDPAKVVSQLKQLMKSNGVAPEFIGRLQHVLPFFPLDAQAINEIVSKELQEITTNRPKFAKLSISWDDTIYEHLASSFQSEFGVRALKREVNTIVRFLFEKMENSELLPSDSIKVHFTNGQIGYTVAE